MLARQFKEGQIILRLRGDMAALNTVMRDPTLARIVEAPHYRQGTKYLVWPTYDFEVSIADSLDGVTHALRSKEYELRDELYYAILDKLKLRKPRVYDFARLNIKGTLLSKRKLKPLMDGGQVKGWDDPRLPTLAGLRRRGILPEAVKSFVLSFGLSKVESEPSWEALLVENRKRLDPAAPRYHFVKDPVRLVVKGAPAELQEVKISLHPERKELGERTVKITNEFHLAKADAEALKPGEVFRLKDGYNVKLTAREDIMHTWLLRGEFVSKEMTPDTKKLQWVPAQAGAYAAASVLVPQELFLEGERYNPKSLRIDRGYVEAACKQLAPGTVLQFLRYGFVRLDDPKEQTYVYSC
jgi:glutamyl-tRNA synthetase